MDKERKINKKLIIVLFLTFLCISVVCFGIFAYLLYTSKSTGLVNDRIVTLSKIIVMTGIFFLVLAFGYLLPVLVSHKK